MRSPPATWSIAKSIVAQGLPGLPSPVASLPPVATKKSAAGLAPEPPISSNAASRCRPRLLCGSGPVDVVLDFVHGVFGFVGRVFDGVFGGIHALLDRVLGLFGRAVIIHDAAGQEQAATEQCENEQRRAPDVCGVVLKLQHHSFPRDCKSATNSRRSHGARR